ncbi:MAG: glycoside hydrolase family 3 C-terminal domain-containing protein, partial [Eubacterium sp.]|nr:glycoside hydrolase family 3 C-terminal domain-containing protein [Eubacterium sp.]
MPPVALNAAEESIVLLKNKDNALPIRENDTVAVFGRCQLDYFYVGYGSGGDVIAPYTVNLIDGLKNAGVNIYI